MSCFSKSTDYPVSPDAYLKRARDQLKNESAQSLFYAAFELRCFVESRQDQYLDAQKEYARSVPKKWRIGAQGKALSAIFESNKIQHISWFMSDVLVYEAYHVPVNTDLRSRAEKFGELLHAQDQWRAPEDEWWANMRNSLLEAYELAWLCNRGMLLSPMFLVEGRAVGRMVVDADTKEEMIGFLQEGAQGVLTVDYPDTLPEDWRSDVNS